MPDYNQKLVVKPHRPAQRKIELVLGVSFGIVLFALGLMLGMQLFGTAMMEKRQQQRELTDLRKQVASLEQRLANAELANRVDLVALEDVRQLVASLQTELAVDKEELGLYRNLLQTGGTETGLMIGELMLRPSPDGQGVIYRLVVQQKETKLKRIKVNINIALKGSQNSEEQSFGIELLDGQIDSSPIQTEFKYFHILEGVMDLPSGFVPTQLVAEAWKKGVNSSRVERSFDWQIDQF